MATSLWDVFLALFGGDDDSDEHADDGRFVPSPLDLSVRVGHGGPDDEIVRELSNVDEQAEDLEQARRGN